MVGFDFEARLASLQGRLEAGGIDAAILLNTRNIYWLAGTAQSAHLLVAPGREPVLLVKRNIELARQHSWFPEEWIVPMRSTKDVVSAVGKMTGTSATGKIIGMELNGLPASFYLKYKELLGEKHAIKNISALLQGLRTIKDAAEIEKVRKAARVASMTQDVVHEMVMEDFKPGTTERDVASEMVRVAKKNGSMHFCIYSNNNFMNFNNFFVIASGEALWTPSIFPIMSGLGSSPAVPYGASDRVLAPGDILVCDYGVLVDGYHSDHTRTYVVDGEFPEHFKERYANLLLAHEQAMESMVAGITAGDLFKLMKENLARLPDPEPTMKIERYFQGNGTYFQALGHGIGLELDEPPFILENVPDSLEANMTLSIEPKIMIPHWGAINLEDNYLVRDNRPPEPLTTTPYLCLE